MTGDRRGADADIPRGTRLVEIFRDSNLVKVQFLAAALDDAGLPFRLHESLGADMELGAADARLLVREQDLDAAHVALREGIAELPALRRQLEQAAAEPASTSDRHFSGPLDDGDAEAAPLPVLPLLVMLALLLGPVLLVFLLQTFRD